MNANDLTRLTLANDARLAKAPKPTKAKRAPAFAAPLRTGHPDQVYDVVTGRPIKMLGRVAVEKRLRKALKSLTTEHAAGLALSRALDLADLEGMITPLTERCGEALDAWEAACG